MDSRWFQLIADRNDGGGGALMDVLNRISSRGVNIVVSSSQCQWSGIDMRATLAPISCSRRSYVTTAAACHAVVVVVVGLPNGYTLCREPCTAIEVVVEHRIV